MFLEPDSEFWLVGTTCYHFYYFCTSQEASCRANICWVPGKRLEKKNTSHIKRQSKQRNLRLGVIGRASEPTDKKKSHEEH